MWPIREKDERTTLFVFDEQTRVAEVLDHALLALNPRVRDVANLLAVELLPSMAIELPHKRSDVLGLYEVDEGVPDVAVVLEVDG